MKIFFNCLVHTNNDIVEDIINNIKKFTKNPVICIHVSKVFEDFDENRFSNIENVYINPERYHTYKGGSFMHPICSNFNFIENIKKIKFDYHMIFYSQMLFIRHGIEEYLKDGDAFVSLHEYHWESTPVIEDPEKRFPKGVIKNLVEGVACSYDVATKSFDFIVNDDHLINNNGWVPEEVVIPSAFLKYAKKIKNYPTSSHSNNIQNFEEVKNLLEDKISFIPHVYFGNQPKDEIYIIHRVGYDYNDPIRNYIRNI